MERVCDALGGAVRDDFHQPAEADRRPACAGLADRGRDVTFGPEAPLPHRGQDDRHLHCHDGRGHHDRSGDRERVAARPHRAARDADAPAGSVRGRRRGAGRAGRADAPAGTAPGARGHRARERLQCGLGQPQHVAGGLHRAVCRDRAAAHSRRQSPAGDRLFRRGQRAGHPTGRAHHAYRPDRGLRVAGRHDHVYCPRQPATGLRTAGRAGLLQPGGGAGAGDPHAELTRCCSSYWPVCR